ncbi:MAG TPA: ABC transporter permease [Bradyrhizobium sp.]|uniref:ABC transporter permease n=1 Tax=Bradyrhizobium sp. TaxID=376 RepID=UPI002C880FC9|nr:ABC transporter permease [Bradyrhizobium sp.]HLZ02904.1 ABC transporter permease [Bradyrhizobium sp.]
MLRYAARRIVLAVPVLFGVSLISFAIIHLIPGDIVSVLAGPTVAANSAAAQNIRHALNLDQPLPVQYGLWLLAALHGDFGNSLVFGFPVGPQIAAHLPVTLVLTALSLIFAIMIGLPGGVVAATTRGRWPDFIIRGAGLLGLSTPPFFVGVTAVLLLSIYLPSFKTLGAVDLAGDPLGGLQTLLLPAVVLSLASATTIMRYTRAAMLEVLAEPYMATARAKGAGRARVLLRHGLRNALLPVVTAIGVTAAQLVAGAVVVEQVFGLPGIGQLMLNAIYHRDYTQVQATVLVVTTLVVLINIAVDLSYYLLDPRIQQHG